MPLKSIHLIECEFTFAQRFDALHDIEKPAASFQRLVSEKQGLLPFGKNEFLVTDYSVLNDVDLSRLRDFPKQDVGPDPAGAPGGRRERSSLLDDVLDK